MPCMLEGEHACALHARTHAPKTVVYHALWTQQKARA